MRVADLRFLYARLEGIGPGADYPLAFLDASPDSDAASHAFAQLDRARFEGVAHQDKYGRLAIEKQHRLLRQGQGPGPAG